MAPAPEAHIPPIITLLTGPLVIGHFSNWFLFGALTVQAYIYYLAFPKDTKIPKYLAFGVYWFEAIQTVIATVDIFRTFITGFGNMQDLNRVGIVWFSACVMGGAVSAMTQIFYAWRIWIFAKSLVIPIIICMLAITQMVTAICAGVFADRVGTWDKVQQVNHIVSPIWLGGTALCDVIIALAMTYYLLTARVGLKTTNLIIVKFVRLSVETGAICALCALIDLILFLVFPDNNLHIAPSIALSKLYSNSLFAVLNARATLLNGRVGGSGLEDVSLSFQFAPMSGAAKPTRLHHTYPPHPSTFKRSASHDIEFATMDDDTKCATRSTAASIDVDEGRSRNLTPIVEEHHGATVKTPKETSNRRLIRSI